MALATSPYRPCKVDPEHGEAKCYGMCWKCAGRFRRNGDPLAKGKHGGHAKGVGSPGEVPDPEPVRRLAKLLGQEQAWQTDWRLAWPKCVADVLASLPAGLADEWREALADTESEWRSAYHREGLPRSISALGLEVVPESSSDYRREGPPLHFTGAAHDGPCLLDPVAVPWCG